MVGYNAEIVKRIMNEAGLVKPVLAAPWKRLYREALYQPNVLAFAVVRTPDREDLFHWITPLTANEYRLYGDQDAFYSSLKQVPDDTIMAVLKRDFRGDIARSQGLITVEYDSWHDAIEGVIHQRADVVFASKRAIELGCQQQIEPCVDIRPVSPIMNAQSWLVMSKAGTSEELAARFKRAADNVKRTGQYQKWAKQWVHDMNGRNQTDYSFMDGVIYLYQVNQK
nr:ABC transporter substrate-binding protein [Alteromonas sp. C1M14]